MSHIASLLTQIRIKEILLIAIERAGYTYQHNKTIVNAYSQKRNVEVAVMKGTRILFGYAFNSKEGANLVYDADDHSFNLAACHAISHAYAEELIVRAMQKNKFMRRSITLNERGEKVLTYGKDTVSVIATIEANGNVTIETRGYKGKSCIEATQQLEIAIGKTAQFKNKPEIYEPPPPAKILPTINIDSLCG